MRKTVPTPVLSSRATRRVPFFSISAALMAANLAALLFQAPVAQASHVPPLARACLTARAPGLWRAQTRRSRPADAGTGRRLRPADRSELRSGPSATATDDQRTRQPPCRPRDRDRLL